MRVLLLEAGGRDNWIWFHIPVGYLFAIGNPRADWMFKTEPEEGLNGRSLNYPRGRVIGGVVVAPRASELILGVSLAVEQHLTVDDVAHTFAVYPSLSGSITEAARRLMQPAEGQ